MTKLKHYGVKRDANHGVITQALTRLGVEFIDLSLVGGGCPDLLINFRKTLYLADIKNPQSAYGKRGLNKNQKRWADEWAGVPIFLLYTEADVVAFANGRLSEIKHHSGAIK